MKEFKGALAMVLCLVMVFCMALSAYAAPEVDETDPEFMYKLYITDFLADDIKTTGKTQQELLDIKADELGISDSRAFELELECGLHPVIYTKDERPLPTTTATTEATESSTAYEAETTLVTEATETKAEETTEEATDAITPTEIVTEPEETSSAPATIDEEKTTNRYYFYKPGFWFDNEYSDTVGIYWWEGTDACESWPGVEAHKADVEGVYYYDVPTDVTTIIWNNFVDGGADTEAEIYRLAYQTCNISTEYYDPGESAVYPNGTESFDGMIFVVASDVVWVSDLSGKLTDEGMWYYYYGNGEYGITPEKGEDFYTTSFLKEFPASDAFDESVIPILGNVNNDDKLNIKDATIIQKYVAKLWSFDNVNLYLADINEDEVVNVKDATHIQKKIANII